MCQVKFFKKSSKTQEKLYFYLDFSFITKKHEYGACEELLKFKFKMLNFRTLSVDYIAIAKLK